MWSSGSLDRTGRGSPDAEGALARAPGNRGQAGGAREKDGQGGGVTGAGAVGAACAGNDASHMPRGIRVPRSHGCIARGVSEATDVRPPVTSEQVKGGVRSPVYPQQGEEVWLPTLALLATMTWRNEVEGELQGGHLVSARTVPHVVVALGRVPKHVPPLDGTHERVAL